jgi:hypothetical protein
LRRLDDGAREIHRAESPVTISDNEESQPLRTRIQKPDVIGNVDTQASNGPHTTTLEEEHDASALEKAAREFEKQEILHRAESAEARCKELEKQLEVVESKLSIQTLNKDIEEKLRNLDVPDQTALRKYVRLIHLERDRWFEQAGLTGLDERTRAEWRLGIAPDIKEESERKIKHLEQKHKFDQEQSQRKIGYLKQQAKQSEEQSQQKIKQLEQQVQYLGEENQRNATEFEQRLKYLEEESQRKIKRLEEQAKQAKQYYEETTSREISKRMSLRRDLLEVKSGIYIYRSERGRFPIEYDFNDLCANWKRKVGVCIDYLARNPDHLPETTLRKDPSLPNLKALLQMVAGIPEMPPGDLDIDYIFKNSLEAPSCYNVTMACFLARVLRWCFDTNWHIDEPECKRMEEVWSAVVRVGK